MQRRHAGGDQGERRGLDLPGYNVDVRVAEGDLRIFVSYGPKAATQTAAYETLPQFNMIGETLEWRVKREAGKLKPFATILRFRWDADTAGLDAGRHQARRGRRLPMAYVEATDNPKANEQARAIADRR